MWKWGQNQERCGHSGCEGRLHLHRVYQPQLWLLCRQLCSYFWSNRQVIDPAFLKQVQRVRLFEIVSNFWCLWSRWVVFALSPKLEAFHESILSYQCVCRGEEREQSNSFDTRLRWKETTCIESITLHYIPSVIEIHHILWQNMVFRCTS